MATIVLLREHHRSWHSSRSECQDSSISSTAVWCVHPPRPTLPTLP